MSRKTSFLHQGFFSHRHKAQQLGGASLLALVVLGCPPSAKAQPFFIQEEPVVQRVHRVPERLEPRNRIVPKAKRPAPRQVARQPEPVKEGPPPPGPHMLIVSVHSQKVSFYADGKLVSQSPVSTGMASHPTPHGVFSIIQRNRHHRSNIYSGAPMPYMQRLTWSGIALHQGALPGHPASHGCIRLPEHYANYLWRTLKMNTRVIVSREDTAPFEITHALLFQPKTPDATVETVPELRKTLDTTVPVLVRTASSSIVANDGAGERVEGEEARASEAPAPVMRDLTSSVQQSNVKDEAKDDAATTVVTQETASPSSAPAQPELAGAKQIEPEATGSVLRPDVIPEPILASFVQTLDAKQKKAAPKGTVSVFISKKEKRLYVRQHFIPLFSAPVSFKDDKANFGTHVFTALAKNGNDRDVRWIAVSMPPELPKVEKPRTRIEYDRRGRPIEVPVKPVGKAPAPLPSLSASAVLDRIEIAPEVADRISEYVTPGASLIVSDHGLGHETGLYTDFIVVTR
nr:L,D-transpeptidase [Pseudorhodoplanes sp.]